MDRETVRKTFFKGQWTLPAVVALAAVVAWAPTVTGGFFWDTPGMRSGGSLFVPFFDHIRARNLFWLSIDLDSIL
ncbi:hypothetical protein LCGC14_3165090, partial [marine sediment metagenome]